MKRREELDKYRDLSDEELQAEAARLKESLFRLKFKLALGEVDAVKRIRQEKRSLARIQTLTRQREPGKSLLREYKILVRDRRPARCGIRADNPPPSGLGRRQASRNGFAPRERSLNGELRNAGCTRSAILDDIAIHEQALRIELHRGGQPRRHERSGLRRPAAWAGHQTDSY